MSISKVFLFVSFLFFISKGLFGQDTTWVQTFTFDSITTRRANFVFPEELKSKRFEKVLMHYKLKCSPLTTWDQYNCGEWDYLTYTRVFDHTGDFDSVRIDGNRILSNCDAPNLIEYDSLNLSYYDNYAVGQYSRTLPNLTNSTIGNSINSQPFPFNNSDQKSRYQVLLSANDLLASGLLSGEIQSLSLFISDLGDNGELFFPSIKFKLTTDSILNGFHEDGFQEVYNKGFFQGNSLQVGENELLFYQPFSWDGQSNIVVEFEGDFNNNSIAVSPILFEGVSTTDSVSWSLLGNNGYYHFDGTNYAIFEFGDQNIGEEFTVEFWSRGDGNTGINTYLMEAVDSSNNRVFNIHMPWSNNNLYFDAGNHTGYDRINTGMSAEEIDGTWNHWAFVKNQVSGEMFIYKNGQLWLSGVDKNRTMGFIDKFIFGASRNLGNNWKGDIDELRIFNTALDQTTIQFFYNSKIDNSHPFWSDLQVYYDFDGTPYVSNKSNADFLLMPSAYGMIEESIQSLVSEQNPQFVPKMSFGQGTVDGPMQTEIVNYAKRVEPNVFFEYEPVNRHFEISNSWIGTVPGYEIDYDTSTQITNQNPFTVSNTITNDTITVYNPPFEIIHDVEIARYITPYGIQFDLGPNGFSWVYDVTDYQEYLKDTVDLAAHNTQELLDLKFAFIEGIPPRDLHHREPIWSDFRSYNFGQMAADEVLKEKKVYLSDTSNMFKLKTRMSGHGQVGNYACCEWVANEHQIKVDGVSRFNWDIWEESDCGDNPNIGQGGTWPYAREGWCPGDKVKEYEFDLTPYVSPGDSVSLDYAINAVPTSDPGQSGGNYIAAYDLISYSEPNFQKDASIKDVLNPNNWEYYSKWNPTCANPRVILQNTGAENLTSCTITCWVTYGEFISLNWTGNLGFLEEEIVEIPVENANFWFDWDSTMTFRAYVHNVNGMTGEDEYNQNSMKTTHFEAPEFISGPFFVWLTTNNKANENNYKLVDASGTVLFERTQLDNQTQYKDTFDLAPGCYSIIIEDTDHDGLSFWYSSQVEGETAGSMRIRLVGGSYLEFFPGDFGHYHRYDFSVGFSVGLEEQVLSNQVNIFPNPSTGLTTIELEGKTMGMAMLELIDLTGRVVLRQEMRKFEDFAESFVDLSSFKKGNYLVKVTTGNSIYTKKLIKL